MRITLRLGKLATTSLELEEIEAKNLYETFSTILASVIGSGVRIDDRLHDGPAQRKTVKQTENKAVAQTENTEAVAKKHLIFFQCEECGEIQYKFGNKGDTATCHKCELQTELNGITDGTYRCPKCNTTATFKVNDEVSTVPCKSCHSPIDLVYHDKKDKFVSSNLL